MDQYRIDSHKLMFHPHIVSDWLKDKPIYPIYVEICPYGGCNHRCVYCAYNYTKYKPISLDTTVLKNRINEMANIGIKAIMYAGEGEPLLHKDISSIINHTKLSGIAVAVTTNGVKFTKEFSEKCLGSISWIKVSIDAGRPETYAKIHGTSNKDFSRILNNLEAAVKIRDSNHYHCAIGAQALLFPENSDELHLLADSLSKIGVDYLVVKPFTDHPRRKGKLKDLRYDRLFSKAKDDLSKYNSEKFKVIIRSNAFNDLVGTRDYKKCYSLDFWAFIDATGDVYACSNFLKNKDYVYGNIYEESFEKIWNNRKKIDIDLSNCRSICRMDKVNQYLWELKHSPEHVNFI